jgi:hypothetical protein
MTTWERVERFFRWLGYLRNLFWLLAALGLGNLLKAVLAKHIPEIWQTPLWLLSSAAILGIVIWIVPAVFNRYPPTPRTWCDEIAASDAKHIRDRVIVLWEQPEPHYFGPGDPYITFMVTFINATIFRLTSEKIEGETFYGMNPLKDAPRIVNQQQLMPLILNHGTRVSLLLRQPLSREVAQRLNEQRGHVALDFSKVWISFRAEGQGAPGTFRLCGDADVTVANRD